MKRFLGVLLAVSCAVPAFAASSSKTTLNKRLDDSATILKQVMEAPDKGIPAGVLEHATCVAIFPNVIKGAIGFGGEYGQGVATCRTAHGWSAPLFLRLAGGSWGLQLGGQATDLVLIAVNQKGMQDLLQSKVKIGANASAAAGPVGRNAGAATNWKMSSELLTYSRSKGLFAGIDLNGATINRNEDDNNHYYGQQYTSKQILQGQVAVPSGAKDFVSTVGHYFHESKTTA